MGCFYLADHQGKGWPYAQALIEAGWARTENAADPDLRLALFDHDVGTGGVGFRRGLDYLHGRGVPVVMYPHAARPMVQWDDIYPVWPHTRLCVVIAEGHRQVMQIYGYPLPVEICGWALCGIEPWRPVEVRDRPVEVLFGPIHPNGNGFLHPAYKAANALVFQRLLETPGVHITVRHIKRLDLNGLWPAPGVEYVLANPNGATAEIDRADVVFGHQTFAFLAVARGKPLVMIGDDTTAHSGNAWENLRWAAHYTDYRELLRYPIEAESARSGRELRSLIEQALAEDAGAAWRERLVGQPFNPKLFVSAMEKCL